MLTELSKPSEPHYSSPIQYFIVIFIQHQQSQITTHQSQDPPCYTSATLNIQVLPYSGSSTCNRARTHKQSKPHKSQTSTNQNPFTICKSLFSSSNVGVSLTRVRCYTKQCISAILYVHF